jgi:hypothetical protein
VFDSRSEIDPFSGVKYWARALAQAQKLEGAAAVPLKTYLVAARTDRGGVAVGAERIRAMVQDLGLDGFFETSAKEGWQVTELTEAIREGIDWDALPTISSSVLFDSIKGFLLEEKQRGRLLCTADDLFHGFERAHPEEAQSDGLRASFETCIGRVESRGLIRRLRFGDLVLLQPELLDAYASGMVQVAREEPDGLGFIAEDDALAGRFRLRPSSPGSGRTRRTSRARRSRSGSRGRCTTSRDAGRAAVAFQAVPRLPQLRRELDTRPRETPGQRPARWPGTPPSTRSGRSVPPLTCP